MRKPRRADELTAAGDTQEEIAGGLDVPAATLYNGRRHGGLGTGAAKAINQLREQNGRLKRLLGHATQEKNTLRESYGA